MRSSRFSLFPVAAAMVAIALIGVACSAPASAPTAPSPPRRPRPARARQRPTPRGAPARHRPPRPSSKPTPVPVPPKPTGVKFDEQGQVSDDESVAEITQTVTWRAPRSAGVEIRVYGVTECIAEPSNPAPNTSGPCLVEHTPLPASVRMLLGTAPASDGVVSWTWTQETGCDIGLAHDPDGPMYHAVVLAAYSASGHSIFAIAEPGEMVAARSQRRYLLIPPPPCLASSSSTVRSSGRWRRPRRRRSRSA